MKRIVIEIEPNQVRVNIADAENFTDLIVALATFEGIVGGVMEADKSEIRMAVDEVQKELQAQLPKGAKDE